MSRVNHRESLHLLETALDVGITHFDTARAYGFGEAEIALGDFIARRRDRVTVTTKVGILPPSRGMGLSAAKAVARGLLSVWPAVRPRVRRRAGRLVHEGQFDVASMRESLHASLRHLHTDHVDFLLLHEPSMEVLATGEPLAFLEEMRREGKVKHFGVAATPEVVPFALAQAPGYTHVLQFGSSVFDPAPEHTLQIGSEKIFTHSAFGALLDELQGELNSDPDRRQHWSETLGLDLTSGLNLRRLALQHEIAARPGGTVLFASTRAEHIRENAAAMEAAASSEQLNKFVELVRAWIESRTSSGGTG